MSCSVAAAGDWKLIDQDEDQGVSMKVSYCRPYLHTCQKERESDTHAKHFFCGVAQLNCISNGLERAVAAMYAFVLN